jgi:hypothetical protein
MALPTWPDHYRHAKRHAALTWALEIGHWIWFWVALP